MGSNKLLGPDSMLYALFCDLTASMPLNQTHLFLFSIEAHAKEVQTPLFTYTSLTLLDGTASVDSFQYKSIIDALQYLSMTRLDIAYPANRLAQFKHKPTTIHLTALKRLLRYLKATKFHGHYLHKGHLSSFYAFSDEDWAGNKDDYTSTSAQLVFYGTLRVQHVSTSDQLADCLTKPLSRQRHHFLKHKIGVLDGTPLLQGRVTPGHCKDTWAL
ncbi:Uncharacterized protein TCM_001419 [Theobroma cacao]|uniref:Uncharacterized protein n=1 Tax=Theobroma cacao TaxID=3641 RepID=A0A061DIU8_THECC|nr:Uncharacterized protein TCM_001419 [Theobroma cacao]